VFRKITHVITCIEAVKRRGTFTAVACEDPVFKVWISKKHRVSEVSYPLIHPKEIRYFLESTGF